MLRLYLDQQEIPVPTPGFSSFDDVVRHVEACHLAGNLVIRQIQVDGRPLVSEDIEETPSRLLGAGTVKKIEITTGTLAEIASDSITEAMSYLTHVETITPSLAAGFQSYPGPEAFLRLKDLYEGFYWVVLLLDRLEKSFPAVPGSAPDGSAFSAADHARFTDVLRQLVDAQEREDFVLVSDLLQYEILPLIPSWRDLLSRIGQTLRGVH